MNDQVKVTGWLWVVSGVLGLMTAICLATAVLGGGLISQDETAVRVTLMVSVGIAGLLTLFSVPDIITGIGLLGFRSWARYLAIVLSFFKLLSFPLGTAVGIFTLIVLLNNQSAALFAGGE